MARTSPTDWTAPFRRRRSGPGDRSRDVVDEAQSNGACRALTGQVRVEVRLMSHGSRESVTIGPLVLAAPPSCRLVLASESPERVSHFVANSPDRTLYHELPLVAFMGAQGRGGDLVLLEEDGEPRFAVPAYPHDAYALDAGYSGLVLPPVTTERSVRRAVGAFFDLLQA